MTGFVTPPKVRLSFPNLQRATPDGRPYAVDLGSIAHGETTMQREIVLLRLARMVDYVTHMALKSDDTHVSNRAFKLLDDIRDMARWACGFYMGRPIGVGWGAATARLIRDGKTEAFEMIIEAYEAEARNL